MQGDAGRCPAAGEQEAHVQTWMQRLGSCKASMSTMPP